jgi:hypothetical protein
MRTGFSVGGQNLVVVAKLELRNPVPDIQVMWKALDDLPVSMSTIVMVPSPWPIAQRFPE